ncbi:hypothetical protein EW145_g5134 [Phellinidium pouzarii]|uniref:Uncharacterized protein n=1 Tax=Phellinidium pouzarii TaxID=167371 RepID=A0A4S4L2F8_9AGAM|nr:hypothetical protein EW145_g5134 [Phellinidium pouzarii]
MLQNRCSKAVVRLCSRRGLPSAAKSKFSKCSPAASHIPIPNAPLELDPSLQNLLRDADMALLRHKRGEKSATSPSTMRELEVVEFDETKPVEQNVEDDDEMSESKERKSARAKFGSNRIGSILLPAELRDAIDRIINEEDKSRLYEDAKRLFREDRDDGSGIWNTEYDEDYKSRKQAVRHADRDGTAFASVALPAHYSIVYAVLDNLNHRLGEEWKMQHVLEWGSGVGSGLWASMHAGQDLARDRSQGFLLSQSTISSYLGIEKRVGLSLMAKRLIEGMDVGSAQISWAKGLSNTELIGRSEGDNVLALSAFHLSSLPTDTARKETIKQMWSSCANIFVLIDHDSTAGFESIAGAREHLLRMGRKELEEPATRANTGCHVVAPRMQRPSFLRKTKHVRAGHEDIGYSYVVIKRGKRPSSTDRSLHAVITADMLEQGFAADANSVHRIRLEAYSWPRLVFAPLKKSGHVVIDGCQIMRMTIPRSQGKQPYYDARKSSWGDIFPHKPKNPPQVRLQPTGKNKSDPSTLLGADIGKRRSGRPSQNSPSYSDIMSDLKEGKSNRRRDRVQEIDFSRDD